MTNIDRKLKTLQAKANEIRKMVLTMAYQIRGAHTGGSLSCVDILTTLYFDTMKVYPNDPENEGRDRLIFSKAHDCKALYATLALCGFFDKKILEEYEKDGGRLPGHSTRHCVPGVEISAGSLGHGLSIAVGMAYAGKIDKKNHRVFAVLSDGECDEGSTWEAILFAGHHKLDNLVVIVDYNKFQAFGSTREVLDLEPFGTKWKDFYWSVKEVDGHNIQSLRNALKQIPFSNGKPSVIIAHTIKGYKGVAQHVGKLSSHYKPPTEEELYEAIKKL
jgi:transketolase